MRYITTISVPALAASLLLAACGNSSSTKTSSSTAQRAAQTISSSGSTVRTAPSSLGTILVDAHGMTLYHLSAEHGGRFICDSGSGCTSIWHPLTITAGSTPSGVATLGTVRRPEGGTQVTYEGAPLYTFAQDSKPGDTKGQGFKDVGTWSVAMAGPASSSVATQTTPAQAPESSGGGYRY